LHDLYDAFGPPVEDPIARESRYLAQAVAHAFDYARDALPALFVDLRRAQLAGLAVRILHDGPRQRMAALPFERGRDGERILSLNVAHHLELGDARRAFGQRTGFIERHRLYTAQLLERG
jgi:hypothetical protein